MADCVKERRTRGATKMKYYTKTNMHIIEKQNNCKEKHNSKVQKFF